MKAEPAPILVAACGNAMAADDAFGPLVARRLRELALRDVDVLDLGLKPVGLIEHLADRQGVIVIDAAEPTDDDPPGSLIDMDFLARQRPQLLHDAGLSSHGLSIVHELELARRLDIAPPRVHLVAATIQDAEMGQPVTAATLKLVEPAAQRVRQLARTWLSEPT